MQQNMYTHPATQANLALLRERGAFIVEPEVGPG
jgi:phosphopantothenoylcysteine decarboxylase/phosphopantothenate--cysteine ligase